jgi:glycosyltransferase involved in cell wall biosynthesis
MKNLYFSICICVYKKDNEIYFQEALESIVNQSLIPNEIVLVVDGKIENNLQNIIDNFTKICEDKKVEFNVTYLEQNVGHGKARKISIENAKYELIALMDADDICRYNRFEKQIRKFQEDDTLSIVGGQIVEIIHDNKKEVGQRIVPIEDKDIKEYLKKRCPFNQMTVMFKKQDVINVGNYIDFFHNEDYYLWVRMYLAGYKFYNLQDTLVDVRINEEFYNRRGGIKYFLSEFRLQKIMYKNNIINFSRFVINSSIRFILQVILSDTLRGILFKKLARKRIENGK